MAISALFAGGEAGGWWDPSDLSTLYQESNGRTPVTAVGQPVGMMLDKSKGLVLEADVVTNGGFADATGWAFNTGWAASGGAAVATAASTSLISAALGLASGDFCRVTFDAVVTSGTVQLNFGGTTQTAISASGSYSYIVPRGTANDTIRFVGASFTGSIDNVTVRRLAGNHMTQATSGQRPTLQQVGGRYVLRFDGTNDNMRAVTGAANAGGLSMSIMANIVWATFRTLAGFPSYPTQHQPNYFQFFLGTHFDVGRGSCRFDNVTTISTSTNFFSEGTPQVYELHSTDGKAYTDRSERMSITPATIIYPRAVPFMIGANGANQEALAMDFYGAVLLARNMTGTERTQTYNDLVTPPTGSATGAASGTIGLTGAASGAASATGISEGALGVTGAAQGKADATGTASGGLGVTGVAEGAARATGAAQGGITLSGSAAGAVPARGAAAGDLSIAGSATGRALPQAVGAGTVPLTGSGAGQAPARAAGAGSLDLNGAAEGRAPAVGAAAGILSLGGTASSGVAPAVTVEASGSMDMEGSATGAAAARGAASGALVITGGAAASALSMVAAAGALVLAGVALARSIARCGAGGQIELTGGAAVAAGGRGQASGVILLAGSALAQARNPDEILDPMVTIPGAWAAAAPPGVWSDPVVPGRWLSDEIQGAWK